MTRSAEPSDFVAALRDPNISPPPGIAAAGGASTDRRFAVYRNNVITSLVNALRDKYPVVCALCGDAFFDAAAAVYVRRNPPRSPVLAEYGEDFPAFLETFEPSRSVPYLSDVSALEAAWLRAYHAEDAEPVAEGVFAAIDVADLPDVRIRFHPSASILQSRFAIASLWAAHRGDLDIADVDPFCGEDVLIVRPRLDVELLRLPEGCATFFEDLNLGRTLGQAAERALASAPGFDLPLGLRILISSGVTAHLHI